MKHGKWMGFGDWMDGCRKERNAWIVGFPELGTTGKESCEEEEGVLRLECVRLGPVRP